MTTYMSITQNSRSINIMDNEREDRLVSSATITESKRVRICGSDAINKVQNASIQRNLKKY